jgi:hypothetical protein
MTEYQTAVFNLAREKAQVYFSGTTMDWHLLTTEMESISMKYCVLFNKVDDDVSTAYKEVVKRTIEYASRNNAVLFSRTETKT